MFKITIFPNATIKIPEEKNPLNSESIKAIKRANGSRAIIGESYSSEVFSDIVEKMADCPSVPASLKDNKRNSALFLSTNLIMLDVDSFINIQEFKETELWRNYKCAIITSFSHSKENNKFHVLVALNELVVNYETFKQTFLRLSSLAGGVNDKAPSSMVNLFFNSNPLTKEIEVNNGSLFPVEKVETDKNIVYKKNENLVFNKALSKRTLAFLKEGAKSGSWHKEFILAAKNLKSAGYSKEESIDTLKEITGKLDSNDLYQLEYCYKNNTFNYDLTKIQDGTHELRAKFVDDKGKPLRIPAKDIVEYYFSKNKITVDLRRMCYKDFKALPAYILIEEIRHFSESELKQLTPASIISDVINSIMFNYKDTEQE